MKITSFLKKSTLQSIWFAFGNRLTLLHNIIMVALLLPVHKISWTLVLYCTIIYLVDYQRIVSVYIIIVKECWVYMVVCINVTGKLLQVFLSRVPNLVGIFTHYMYFANLEKFVANLLENSRKSSKEACKFHFELPTTFPTSCQNFRTSCSVLCSTDNNPKLIKNDPPMAIALCGTAEFTQRSLEILTGS